MNIFSHIVNSASLSLSFNNFSSLSSHDFLSIHDGQLLICLLVIENHDMKTEAKLLKGGHKPAELTIWKKLFIHKFKNRIINFEIPKENDLISRWIQPIMEPSTGPVNNLQSK